MKFIAGLGNPGRRYARSRHNVGFLTLEEFRARHGFPEPRKRFRAEYSAGSWPPGAQEGCRLFLLWPQTYMNLSGHAVRDVLRYFAPQTELSGGDLSDLLLVVYDDLDLEPGRLRYRARGSSGGHRGVQSVIDQLGTDRFSRLRIGVGRPPAGQESADYVLEPLREAEWRALQEAARRAAATLPVWIEEGILSAMQRFNARSEQPGGSSPEPRSRAEGDG